MRPLVCVGTVSVLLLLAVVSVTAEPGSDTPASVTYAALLADAESDKDGADFVALRHAFASSDAYNPYDVTVDNLRERAFTAMEQGDSTLAIARAESLLDIAYPSMETQFLAVYVFDTVGDSVRAFHHARVFNGLRDAAFSTGDGSSADSAITVIYVGEEYMIVEVEWESELEEQAILQSDGHSLDTMRVINTTSGETRDVFFNVDALVATWERLFGK